MPLLLNDSLLVNSLLVDSPQGITSEVVPLTEGDIPKKVCNSIVFQATCATTIAIILVYCDGATDTRESKERTTLHAATSPELCSLYHTTSPSPTSPGVVNSCKHLGASLVLNGTSDVEVELPPTRKLYGYKYYSN